MTLNVQRTEKEEREKNGSDTTRSTVVAERRWQITDSVRM